MTTVVFYLLVGLTAAKAYLELVHPPREWVGEVMTMLVALVVASLGAGALHVAGL